MSILADPIAHQPERLGAELSILTLVVTTLISLRGIPAGLARIVGVSPGVGRYCGTEL